MKAWQIKLLLANPHRHTLQFWNVLQKLKLVWYSRSFRVLFILWVCPFSHIKRTGNMISNVVTRFQPYELSCRVLFGWWAKLCVGSDFERSLFWFWWVMKLTTIFYPSKKGTHYYEITSLQYSASKKYGN